MPRLLLIEIDDEGNLKIHSSSDTIPPHELIGIAAWLDVEARYKLVPEEDA